MDGELSELESALLEAHLKRCEPCRAFSAGVESVALQLRSATLERLEEPVVLPSRHSAPAARVVRVSAAAALVAAAAGLGTLFGAIGPHSSGPVPSTTAPLVSAQLAGSLAFAVDERPRGLPLYPQRDYMPRKGLALGTADV
jgi:predicted anti-sigma-YlaC factor YlaD